jgi:hypothetical protein
MSPQDVIRPVRHKESKLHRTSIAALEASGYRLSEEHLRLASEGRPRALGTCTYPGGMSDADDKG